MTNLIKTRTEKEMEKWLSRFEELKSYLLANNNKYPSRYTDSEQEKSLTYWINTQRQNARKNLLSKKRINRLNSIDFIWYPQEESWEKNFEMLVAYLKENNGQYPAITEANKELKDLAIWVTHQRQAKIYKTLSKEREQKLNSIDFVWKMRDEFWIERFEALKKFLKNSNGRYPTIISNNKEEKHLAQWVINQRRYVKNGGINKERYNTLRRFGFKFEHDEQRMQEKQEKAIASFFSRNK